MIPFSPPRIDQAIIDEVTDTLQSGWITTGPKTKRFEERLSEFNGNPKTLCVSSATAGIELMMRWLGVGPGDEVIIPAYTYCATGNVVEHCGATAVMVDCGADFNLDPEQVAARMTANTKAVVPVDIGGWPCDYTRLRQIVAEAPDRVGFNPTSDAQRQMGRPVLLADAAHSLGAFYQGKRTGVLADVSVFSFHAVKNLTTAEGGAIALNLPESFDHDALYRWLNVASLHGQSKDALSKMKVGGWRYDVEMAGFKCNMTDIQAAMGLVELARYQDDTLVRRRAIFDRYTEAFAKKDWAITPVYENDERTSSYHVYMLRLDGIDEAGRDAVIQGIYEREVAVNVHFQPLPLLSHYKDRYHMEDYPKAWELYSSEISLPVYYNLSDESVDTVIEAVSAAVESVLA